MLPSIKHFKGICVPAYFYFMEMNLQDPCAKVLLPLFTCDFRLVEDEERVWTDQNIDAVAMKHFPNINKQEALARPILFSNWLSKDYIPVDQEELRDYTKARLKVGHWKNLYLTMFTSMGFISQNVRYKECLQPVSLVV